MDVASWLRNLGLERYEAAFRENAVSADVLCDLTAEDLEGLGVAAIGHRRRLLVAIAKLREDPSPQTVMPTGEHRASPSAAERRQITVLFCDIVGSTPLSTELDPEELREILSVYQTNVGAAVTGERGYIARFVGDGVLAYFGWPNADEAHAESAVRAGLAIIEAIRPQQLSVRIGIATGLVVTGDLVGVGAAQTMTAVGETPNLAARLQGLAQPDTIVVSDATRTQLGQLFELEDLGLHTLKGFDAPVRPWRVLRKTAAVSRSEVVYATALTPLVGRDEELGLLLRRWHESRVGEGRVVLLSGEAGIGKSRLLAALEERLAGEPHVSLRYFCSPHHRDSPLYPLIARFERDAGFIRSDTAADRLAKLEATLAPTAPPPEDVVLLAALLAIPTDGRYPALELSPQQRKMRTFTALLRRLSGLACREPLLLLFEDAHWSDPTSVELLAAMIEQVPSLPVLLIVSFRPEFAAPWFGRPRVNLMALSRLDRRDATALASQVVKNHVLSSQMLDRIAMHSDGVPLFIEELSKAVLETSGAGSEDATLAVPNTLQATLTARLDRLPAAKRVAQIGSVIGREFPYTLLKAIAELQDTQLTEGLNELAAAGLLFRRGAPPDAVYMFKHALVQDAAYGTLLRSRRQHLHARIVETLESQFPEVVANDPERLAQHCMEAGQAQNAIEYWRRAAEASISRSANVEAVRQTQRALEVLRSLPESAARDASELRLLVPRGVGLQALHGYGSNQVQENYSRANEICRTASDIPELIPVLRGLYVNHLMQGSLSTAHEIGSHLLRLADRVGDEGWRLEARFAFGQTLAFHKADFARARDVLMEGEALYDIEKHGRHAFVYGQDPGVYCLVLGGWVHYLLGYPDTALNKARRAILLADKLGHPLSRAAARALTTQLLQWLRIDAGVRELAAETINIAQAHGLPFFQAWADVSLGWSLVSRGEIESGRQKMAAAIEEWLRSAGQLVVPYLRCLLANAHALAGESEKGLAEIANSFAMAERNGEKWLLSEMHRLAGHVSEAAQQLEIAEERYEQAIHVARGQRAKSLELRAATDLGRLWASRGEMSRAAALLRPLCAFFVEGLANQDFIDAKSLMERCASYSDSFRPLAQ